MTPAEAELARAVGVPWAILRAAGATMDMAPEHILRELRAGVGAAAWDAEKPGAAARQLLVCKVFCTPEPTSPAPRRPDPRAAARAAEQKRAQAQARTVAAHQALEQRAAETGVPVEIRFRAEANQARQSLEAYARAAGLDLVRVLAT